MQPHGFPCRFEPSNLGNADRDLDPDPGIKNLLLNLSLDRIWIQQNACSGIYEHLNTRKGVLHQCEQILNFRFKE
jgi:hypothetical protein